MSLVIDALSRRHDKNDFDCGEPELNSFLQKLARQQAEKDFNRTYVVCGTDEDKILGFYAISFGSMNFENWPDRASLPRYPVPVVRIGRLAVDLRVQGRGVGTALVRHAMQLSESTAEKIGLYAVVVDAKHDAAANFYKRYGFACFPDRPLELFLTLKVVRRALALVQHQARPHPP